MRFVTKIASIGAAISLIVAGPAAAVVQDSDRERARAAAYFVVQNQNEDGSVVTFSTIGSTADAVVSLTAVGRGEGAINKAIDYLREHEAEVDTVGEKAKVIQALVAADWEPRQFPQEGGRNLVREIKDSLQEDGRLGAGTQVFDHANAILALTAAHATVAPEAVEWLVAAQCADGGWQFDQPSGPNDDEHCFDDSGSDFTTSDTNTTSLAVQALVAAHQSGPALNPFAFFRSQRDEVKGGWPYSAPFLTDANSTALVIQAYVATGRDIPDGGKNALRKLQYPLCKENGAFAFTWEDYDEDGVYHRTAPDVGATIQGILGLLEQPFPVDGKSVDKGVHAPAC